MVAQTARLWVDHWGATKAGQMVGVMVGWRVATKAASSVMSKVGLWAAHWAVAWVDSKVERWVVRTVALKGELRAVTRAEGRVEMKAAIWVDQKAHTTAEKKAGQSAGALVALWVAWTDRTRAAPTGLWKADAKAGMSAGVLVDSRARSTVEPSVDSRVVDWVDC